MEQPAINLLKPAQAAALLGLRPGTLEVWRATGAYSLPYIKSGGRVMYTLADVEEFIRARRVVPGEDPKPPRGAPKVRRRTHRKAVA
jgi:hypothetical protein